MADKSWLPAEQRKALILSAAVQVANSEGLSQVTFKTVSKLCAAPTTPRTIQSYFKIAELRLAIVADARANQEVLDTAVAMGLV